MLLIIILCTFLVVRYYTLKYGLFIWWPDCLGNSNTYVNDDTLGTTLKPSSGSPPTPRYSRPCKRQDLPSPTIPRPFQPSRNGGFLRAIRDTRRQSLVPVIWSPTPGRSLPAQLQPSSAAGLLSPAILADFENHAYIHLHNPQTRFPRLTYTVRQYSAQMLFVYRIRLRMCVQAPNNCYKYNCTKGVRGQPEILVRIHC